MLIFILIISISEFFCITLLKSYKTHFISPKELAVELGRQLTARKYLLYKLQSLRVHQQHPPEKLGRVAQFHGGMVLCTCTLALGERETSRPQELSPVETVSFKFNERAWLEVVRLIESGGRHQGSSSDFYMHAYGQTHHTHTWLPVSLLHR